MMFFKNFYILFKSINIFGFMRLVIDLFITKLFYPNARILRRPFFIRNEGSFSFEKGLSTGPGLIIEVFGKNAKIQIGKNMIASNNLHIGASESVIIGNNVLIAGGVYISDHNHGSYSGEFQSSPLESPVNRELTSLPVKIGNNVWIGERVSILPGVSIGQGVVIGAGSVVTRSLPDFVIAAGVPAKIIKQYDLDKKIWRSEK